MIMIDKDSTPSIKNLHFFIFHWVIYEMESVIH